MKNDLQLLKRKHRESRIDIVNFMSMWVCFNRAAVAVGRRSRPTERRMGNGIFLTRTLTH